MKSNFCVRYKDKELFFKIPKSNIQWSDELLICYGPTSMGAIQKIFWNSDLQCSRKYWLSASPNKEYVQNFSVYTIHRFYENAEKTRKLFCENAENTIHRFYENAEKTRKLFCENAEKTVK